MNYNNLCFADVIGGLGNQLFIIAAAYAYAKKYDKDFYIRTTNWGAMTGTHPNEYRKTIFKNLPFWDGKIFPANAIHDNDLNPKLPYKPGTVCFSGYFQSLGYFEEYKDEFISKLWLPEIKTKILNQKPNVAFHIRRGDYLQLKNLFYVCNTTYFDYFFKLFSGFNIHVFTDSPKIVLEEFKDKEFKLIQTSSELNDLTLMSLHDNIVCSNSSFSWWASILGKPKKEIHVPKTWIKDRQMNIHRQDMIIHDI